MSSRVFDLVLGIGIGTVAATCFFKFCTNGDASSVATPTIKVHRCGACSTATVDASPILPRFQPKDHSPSSSGMGSNGQRRRRRKANSNNKNKGSASNSTNHSDYPLGASDCYGEYSTASEGTEEENDMPSQSVHRIGGGASPFRYESTGSLKGVPETSTERQQRSRDDQTPRGETLPAETRGQQQDHEAKSPTPRDNSKLPMQEDNPLQLPSYHIWRIALTGGPCSGKSTCMEELRRRMSDSGFIVFVVPEVASMLIIGGMRLGDISRDARIQCQRVILQTIMVLEDAFYEIARSTGKPHCVLLCDRGTMDGRAYCNDDEFEEVMKAGGGHSVVELRDARYDAVVHLVTAAIGAEKYYTNANNEARRETLEESRALDEATRSKWIGHRHLCVVDNSTNFDDKVERAAQYISDIVNAQKTQTVVYAVNMNNGTSDGKTGDDNGDDGDDEAGVSSRKNSFEWPATETVEITVHDLVPLKGFSSEQAVKRKTHNVDIMYHVGTTAFDAEASSDQDKAANDEEDEGAQTSASSPPPGGKLQYVRICAADYHRLLDTRRDSNVQPRVRNSTAFFFINRYFKLEENLTVPLPEDWCGYRWRLIAPKDCPKRELPPFVPLVKEATE